MKTLYIKTLKTIKEHLGIVNLERQSLYEEINWLSVQINDFKPVVAITGKFSAGKSRLLNQYLGLKVLPEDQSPKTAFATELYHADEQQRLELIHGDETIETVCIDQLEAAEVNQRVKYARLFINSARSDELSRLVLVDMPGFDSGLQAHQKAISYYLGKADYFVNLLPVEIAFDNSVNKHLEEIYYDHGKNFACLLTKAARKTPSELERIKSSWLSNLQPVFPQLEVIGHVETVGEQADIEAFENIIESCLQRSDEFLNQRWGNPLANLIHTAQGAIRQEIHLAKADDEELRQALAQTEQLFNRLQKQLHDEFEQFQYRLTGDCKDKLLAEARSVLHGSSSQLEQAVKTNSINEMLATILRPVIQSRLRQMIEHEMQQLQIQLNQLTITHDSAFNVNIQLPAKEKSDFSMLFTSLAGGVGAWLFGPEAAALLGLLGNLLGRATDHGVNEAQIRQKIESEVIPKALSQVDTQIGEGLKQACQKMESAMQERLQQERTSYEQKKQEIEADLEQKKQDKQEFIQRCQNALQAIEQQALKAGLTLNE